MSQLQSSAKVQAPAQKVLYRSPFELLFAKGCPGEPSGAPGGPGASLPWAEALPLLCSPPLAITIRKRGPRGRERWRQVLPSAHAAWPRGAWRAKAQDGGWRQELPVPHKDRAGQGHGQEGRGTWQPPADPSTLHWHWLLGLAQLRGSSGKRGAGSPPHSDASRDCAQ